MNPTARNPAGLLALCACLAAFGCREKPAAPEMPQPPKVSVTPPPGTTAQPTTPASPVPQAAPGIADKSGVNAGPNDPIVVTTGATNAQQMLTSLNFAFNMWMEQKGGKHPTSLQQMVAAKLIDRIPTPPPGMKFEVNKQKNEVVLVRQ